MYFLNEFGIRRKTLFGVIGFDRIIQGQFQQMFVYAETTPSWEKWRQNNSGKITMNLRYLDNVIQNLGANLRYNIFLFLQTNQFTYCHTQRTCLMIVSSNPTSNSKVIVLARAQSYQHKIP